MSQSKLVDRMIQGDRAALARLITLVENRSDEVPEIMSQIYEHLHETYFIGITGPPGAGKSTLLDRLIIRLRKEGRSVGVVAIDPSSPFSGGALLGDRIRMQRHALDDGVFIRSLGTRGTRGGLSRSTREVSQLFSAFGMEIVLIETVGVGQTELDIMSVADTTIVVLVPESGDTIQTMKAGLMEIADIFVVNKADREGAERVVAELRTMVNLFARDDAWQVPVLDTQASLGLGIDELLDAVLSHRAYRSSEGDDAERRGAFREYELLEILVDEIHARLLKRLTGTGKLAAYSDEVKKGNLNPYEAVLRIMEDRDVLDEFARGKS